MAAPRSRAHPIVTLALRRMDLHPHPKVTTQADRLKAED
jgi:hypothetical protein